HTAKSGYYSLFLHDALPIWITLFSPEAVAKFDYVFTDAMTFTDSKGRRNRIWIPEEVWVDDKQQFMDDLVTKIEAIFSQEPVDRSEEHTSELQSRENLVCRL